MGMVSFDASLVHALLRPEAFDHAADSVELIETHISWVILAGEYAYKIKKPIVLDFLDFGKLDKRRFCCEEELRLNQPSAPELYLDVVPITMQAGQPRFGGDGEPIEYAVRMRRFDQSRRLDRQLEQGRLTPTDMQQLGENIAARHDAAKRPPASDRDRLIAQVDFYIWENFQHLVGIVEPALYDFLHDWTAQELDRLAAAIGRRFDDGFFRDCHGDLHLGNLVRLEDRITTFDCIDFNPDLRNSDVVADTAFLTMDLVEKGRNDLAAVFLNSYLERSGDYAGLVMLDLYFVYRCLVRAKVAAIRSRERDPGEARDADIRTVKAYCDLARRQATKGPRVLVVMSGLSGSGKTWLSGHLLAELVAIRVRSDVERKRLFGLGATAQTESKYGEGIYSAEASIRTYARLNEYAKTILAAGHHVILDAAFLKRQQRDNALAVARNAGFEAVLLRAEPALTVLRDRLRARVTAGDQVSEADAAVLDNQLVDAEPLSGDELAEAIVVDTGGNVDVAALAAEITARLGRSSRPC